jgi:peptidoglycan/xylan/chitin deacetylase (PgdA/CDA1 family)
MKRVMTVLFVFFILLFLTLPNPNALDLEYIEEDTIEYKNSKQLQVNQIPILMYHSISDIKGTYSELCVSPNSFKEQMNYLKQVGYTTVTFYDLANHIEHGEPLPEKPIILTFDDGYLDNYENAFSVMKDLDMVGVIYPYINKIDSKNGLTIDQLAKMHEEGWEVGSHTINHLDLTSLTESQLLKEINDSKLNLEKTFNCDIVSFCYPAGKYNENVVKVIKASDYKFGVTTNYGQADLENNTLKLSRIRINRSDTLKTFAKKVS